MSLDLPTQGKSPVSQERLLLDIHTNDSSLESLCSLCRAVDWPNVTNWHAIKSPPTTPGPLYGKKVLVFGESSRAQLLVSRCCVCRLIGHLFNPDLDGRLITTYCLRADAYLGESFVNDERSQLVKLTVHSPPTGFTAAFGEDHDYTQFLLAYNFIKGPYCIRTLQPSLVDFEFFKAKLQLCKDGHEECRRSTTSEATELYVIDVVTEERVPAKPGCEYIALSYVWGQETSHEHEKKFSTVVQDAMFVTNALGRRYLWVDRYCILQESSHKKSMIQPMDRVYANASVTIIAASGSGADEGLPGVSGPPRYQGRITIGKTRLLEMSTVGSGNVKRSKWATRGWTYQEGCLSRRRLIFTEKEVLFLCNKLLVKETQTGHDADPYKIMATEKRHMLQAHDHETAIWKTFDWMMPLAGNSIYGVLNGDLGAQIEEYTGRSLSKDEDSLNAFLAILRHYELTAIDECGPVSHLWGIPMKLLAGSAHSEERVFFDLLWAGQPGAYRRKDFPSWSWSGWRGPIKFMKLGAFQYHVLAPADGTSSAYNMGMIEHTVQVRVHRGDETIHLHRFIRERQLDTPRDADPRELLITSFVIPLRFCEVDAYPETGKDSFASPSSWRKQPPIHLLEFLICPGIFLGLPLCLDREYDSESHKWGLVLPSSGRFFKDWSPEKFSGGAISWGIPKESDYYTIIILQQVDNGRYERAGMVNLFYNAKTGELSHNNSRTDWNMHLDEKGCAILKEKRTSSPYEYSFLEGKEWRTVCLV